MKHSNYKGDQEYGMPSARTDGYLAVYNRKTKKKEYLHRAIWETVYGPIPDGLTIDHINSKRNDNRIENLQLLTHAANVQRKHRGNVYLRKNGKWEAKRVLDGERHMATFGTKCGALMFNQARRYL